MSTKIEELEHDGELEPVRVKPRKTAPKAKEPELPDEEKARLRAKEAPSSQRRALLSSVPEVYADNWMHPENPALWSGEVD